MSLKSLISKASMPFRDIELALDGARVYEREVLLNKVANGKRRLIDLERERRRIEEREDSDARLSQPDPALQELERDSATVAQLLESNLAEIEKLEQQLRDSIVKIRFTALPKHQFEELQTQAAGKATKTYSLLARASGKHLNGDTVEDIPDDVWDLLETNLTVGQWQQIVEAIDTVNVVEGKQSLGFLNASAPTPHSAPN